MKLDSKGYAEGVGDTEVVAYSSSPLPHSSPTTETGNQHVLVCRPTVPLWRVGIAVALLLTNYFLAQYDKFILSYFQSEVTSSLSMSLSEYGILSGYATGIVYALLAIPVAYLADYTGYRVWILSVSALWWSLCVIFQGLSHNFWQILLARIGMGIGQAPVEALSVSLISDLVGKEWVFFAESVLYVGVYIGEAISAQIATAFKKTDTPWNTAMKAIGIVGLAVAVLVRVVIREPARQTSLKQGGESLEIDSPRHAHTVKSDFVATLKHVLRMRSFWLLTISAGFRQLSGNVFGYYMPGYLSSIYPSQTNLLSNYGIIVGVVGSFSVVAGGLISSFLSRRTVMTPLYMTAIGGMISSIFVVLMIFSKAAAGGSESRGTTILYGVMSAAYLTAETWLGAFNSLLVLLLPPQYKTFGLAIYMSTLVLMYSTGPQIMAFALRNIDVNSEGYIKRVRIVLAVLIPLGYWLAGVGFLFCVRKVRQDIQGDYVQQGEMSPTRKWSFTAFAVLLGCLVIALFVNSLIFR
ncbi:major facilitator superfamily domain-containing protein [Amylocarpus encephaloides]|uniref:Major facilitator superfamily domain-containing protein n=1 Tax=Amylocarpus encephaloides TaxID=45428 RepID=A0A9P8C8D7_9HELO|nr:major facilitator superfamily domain-containing protein [Amylocarpus encephaloides]